MKWTVEYLPEALQDFRKLDESQRILVRKAIQKVSVNPLPASEGGYGKPLGNKRNRNLVNLLKIKIKAAGIRIVYKIERVDEKMVIIVIAMRADDEVYDLADNRT